MNDPERDLKLRQLATEISHTCAGKTMDVAVGAVTLYLVCLVEMNAENRTFATMLAQKLREVADLIESTK